MDYVISIDRKENIWNQMDLRDSTVGGKEVRRWNELVILIVDKVMGFIQAHYMNLFVPPKKCLQWRKDLLDGKWPWGPFHLCLRPAKEFVTLNS